MSESQGGSFVTPFGVGRGRGLRQFLQFNSPVQGGGIVMSGIQGTSGAPLFSTDVAPPPSQSTSAPTPASQSTGAPTPASQSTGAPTPASQHTGSPAPARQSTDFPAPVSQSTGSPVPTPDVIAASIVSQMGDVLIQQVSQRVAQEIISHLSPSVNAPLHSATPPSNHANIFVSTPLHSAAPPPTHANVSATNALDVSHLQYVSHRKLKEPPCFRGDSSDSVSIQEWEELMRSFIKRGNLQSEEQAEEILTHLRGKAKDVARFGTRNSDIDITRNPDAIYGLLRKHFDSATCSSLPLADFYTTLPEKGEDVFDYWLRLNRAVDLATERLKEQGKTLDSPGTEVTRMFVKNCPSTELAMTFRSKTIDRWTAHEVQDILNEYHSEITSTTSRAPKERVSVNALAAVPTTALHAEGQSPLQPQATDPDALNRLISMLEKVLRQRPVPGSTRQSGPRFARVEGLNNMPCSVCQDAAHSAFTHCRDCRLCFQCHSPDHSRRDCPNSTAPNSRQQPGN